MLHLGHARRRRMGEKFEENNMKRSKQRRKSDTLSLLDYLGGM